VTAVTDDGLEAVGRGGVAGLSRADRDPVIAPLSPVQQSDLVLVIDDGAVNACAT